MRGVESTQDDREIATGAVVDLDGTDHPVEVQAVHAGSQILERFDEVTADSVLDGHSA